MHKFYDYMPEWIFATIGVSLLSFALYAISSKHEVKRYYLTEDDHQKLAIGLDIDWMADQYVRLDRSIPYWEAITMVDSLNKTLK